LVVVNKENPGVNRDKMLVLEGDLDQNISKII